jgi:hypothetical protein
MTLEAAMLDLIERSGQAVVLNDLDAGHIDAARRTLAQAVPAARFLLQRLSNPPRSGLLVPNP